MASHHLAATPDTIHWGTFSSEYAPVLTVESGETVVLECVSGAPDVMPPSSLGLVIPPALAAIHAANPPRDRARGGLGVATGPWLAPFQKTFPRGS